MAQKPTARKPSKRATANSARETRVASQSNSALTGVGKPGPDASPVDENYVEEFRRAAHQAVDWIARYLADPREYPVLPRMSPGELEDRLPADAPEQGTDLETLLASFEQDILPAVTHWNHPRFFAYFATSSSSPAIVADLLAVALNTNGLHWQSSPALVELEQVTLRWLAQWLGVPQDWFGIICDTASVSTLHAIAAAREMAAPEAREHGCRGDLVLYTSEQSHSSVEKAAIALGIGQRNVRKIPVDSEFRMRPDALEGAIREDIAAGRKPFCVVATVGTTSTTSVDSVAHTARIAEAYELWLHVDAAYAGSAAMLPERRDILAGLDRAHSLVVNPHKWMFVPVDLSVLYTRHPEILRRAFSLVPEYLRTAEDPRALNLMDYAIPLGRRFRALKLWFVMRYFGRPRIEEILRTHIAWAQRFAELVRAHPRFEVAAPVPFSVVCFRYKGSDGQNQKNKKKKIGDEQNTKILQQVNASGQAYISHTILNGQYTLRLAIGNLGTTWCDVEATWSLIQASLPE
jgi:aromatic-L-amino-acid/L-tryptophan decarboxylase